MTGIQLLFRPSAQRPLVARDKYRELQHIKSLIERTRRRFKVVFAGLQNVERFFRDPNSPWQNFGSATLIGPMLRGAELREAERLVRQPLETLGFFFPDPDAVRLLLVYSNYYPSLIQVFCRRLLAHANSARKSANPSASPKP
jgi:hypothetical protein